MERKILSPRSALAAPALLAAALGAGAAGCLRNPAFTCERDSQCTGNTIGRCETGLGFCSFSDGSCTSGFRFGDHSGAYSGQCVGENGIDAGIDAPTDGSIDGPLVGCPGTYAALPGVATHVYRVINALQPWATQRSACTGENAYLVEPDDATELAAVNMAAGANEIWIGVTDQATEGVFVTSRGAAVTFLPWEAGQPDDQPQPGADCVRSSATGTYADDRCSTTRRAVCECEPP
jgi:hypothetical protein